MCRWKLRFSAEPKRCISVTAPVLAPEATVKPARWTRKVDIPRETIASTWLSTCGWGPDSFMAHFTYGELHHRAGETEQAIDSYWKAIEANPGAAGFLQQRIDQLQNPPQQ